MLNKIELVNLEEITPYDNNPRDNNGSVDYVANSIKEFDFIQPIIVDKNKVIIAGHTRYKASQKLGLKQVPVIIADNLSEEKAKAYRIADNSTGDNSKWIGELLYSEIADIVDIDMSTLGVNLDDLGIEEINVDELDDKKEQKSKVNITIVIDKFSDYEIIKERLENLADEVNGNVSIKMI